jgi:hypothetical protein
MPLLGVREQAATAEAHYMRFHHFRLRGVLGARLRDERGMALIMTLGVLMVLTVAMTSVISFSSANARSADRGGAAQQAFALAEAGLNNAVSVLHGNYPGTVAYPGDPTLLPARTTVYDYGATTWSGTLAGPLTGPWRFEWRITSTGTVRNPTGPLSAPVAHTATAIVPVVIPTTTLTTGSNVLNWIFSGTDTHFGNSVQIGSPVYATRDLWLSNQSKVQGAAHKLVVGRNLHLTGPQNQVGLVSGLTPADTRIDEAHVVGQCASQAIPLLHSCLWDADLVFATVHDNTIPAALSATPVLTCCAPYAGAIAPAGTQNPSTMGFWYQYADLGPSSPCDPATKTGTPPTFESVGNNAIDNSATPATAFNLTPSASYTCKSVPGSAAGGELSWNAGTNVLTVKGTIFLDGSATVVNTGVTPTYDGQATLMLSGTFSMKNSKICAVVAAGDCNVASGGWNPNTKALVIVADGDGAAGGAQSQTGDVVAGEGIHLKGSSFQGALMANKLVREETSCAVQGPMISVYSEVWAGQSCAMTFPAISFAPSGGASVASGAPSGELLTPQNFGG